MSTTEYVTASEIGSYVYCKRAWWLRFAKIVTTNTPEMLAGTKGHEHLAQQLHSNTKKLVFAHTLIIVSIIFLVVLLLLVIITK